MKNYCGGAWVVQGDAKSHCSVCDSIDADSVLVLLISHGVTYLGPVWNSGYPQRFDFRSVGGSVTFYSQHLNDASEDQMVLWNRLVEGNLEVRFEKLDDGMLKYVSPGRGYEASGTIGGERLSGNVNSHWFEEASAKA